MLGKADQILLLLRKDLSGEITDSEKVILDEWVRGSEAAKKLYNELSDPEVLDKELKAYFNLQENISEDHLQGSFQTSLTRGEVVALNKYKRNYYFWFIAASVVLLVGLGSYLTFFDDKPTDSKLSEVTKNLPDVEPGSYKAKLTLADGSIVVLDSAFGELMKQGSVIVKNENGQLLYDASKVSPNRKDLEGVYNVLSTSTGEAYVTILADGSKIWLNSGSSLRYPVAFTDNERVIEASGEIFLEVAKDLKRPFRVQVLQQTGKKCEIEVLGTHFNIMAYTDEPLIQTTLLEGKIAIAKNGVKKILSPGQQAALNYQGSIQVFDDVDTERITAWKNQDFYFRSNDLKTIMRHLARWYGIQVEYKGIITDEGFSGQISRNKNLSEVLKMIEQSGIRFKIEGRKVTVNED